MGDLVNLSRARKARVEAADKAKAAANRVSHGRSKAEREAARKAKEAVARALDGSKLSD